MTITAHARRHAAADFLEENDAVALCAKVEDGCVMGRRLGRTARRGRTGGVQISRSRHVQLRRLNVDEHAVYMVVYGDERNLGRLSAPLRLVIVFSG